MIPTRAIGTAARPNGHVLVVDDDALVRDTLVELIRTDGIPAVGARHGGAALSMLGMAPDSCSLIILDWTMPCVDGYAFLQTQRLDAALSSIPVIVLSTDDLDPSETDALELGLWLRKPVDVGVLLHAIRSYCNAPDGAGDPRRFGW